MCQPKSLRPLEGDYACMIQKTPYKSQRVSNHNHVRCHKRVALTLGVCMELAIDSGLGLEPEWLVTASLKGAIITHAMHGSKCGQEWTASMHSALQEHDPYL